MGKRKLSVLLAFVFVLGCVGQAVAAYTLDWFWLQHRVYEDGRKLNRIAFGIKDGTGQYVRKNLLRSITLTDPDGNAVPLTKADLKFDVYNELDGGYDGNNGVFSYGALYKASGYSGDVPGKLIPGNYHVRIKYGATVWEGDYPMNQLVSLPVIPASSIKTSVDKLGNLTAQWSVPMALCITKPTLPTSVRVWIDVYQDSTFKTELWVRIPTHMGRLFVPKALVNQLKKQGNKYIFGLQLRTNDNQNRTYANSKSIALSSASQALSDEIPTLEGMVER